MNYGFHISITKKQFKKAIQEAHNKFGINAIQFFLKTPRRKIIPEIDENEINECAKYVKDNNIVITIHSSYLMNIATLDDYEYKLNTSLQDIRVIHKMGGIGAVFHVGKSLKMDHDIAINNMKNFISDVLSKIDNNEKFILETAAGCGTELCSNLNDLANFYNKFSLNEKMKLGICIDTCHVFSAGYDLSSKKAALNFIQTVHDTITWDNVCLIHLNDSKKECNCRVDRHENLCKGYIGKDTEDGFKILIQYFNCMKIPVILETPDIEVARRNELKLINNWINKI